MGYSNVRNAKIKDIGRFVRVESSGIVYLFTLNEWAAARSRAFKMDLVPLLDTFTEKFVG